MCVCVDQIQSLQEDKRKLEGDVNGLQKKVKGQASRDMLISTLQGRIEQLQQQVDEEQVGNELQQWWNRMHRLGLW